MSSQFLTIFRWHVLRYVARHKLLATLNVLSVALGVAVYLAIQIANRSANESFTAGVDLVAGKAHLEIRGRVPETVWPKIAGLPGVEAVTAVHEGVVTLPDYPGDYLRLLGVDLFTSSPFRTFEIEGDGVRLDFEGWLARPGSIAVTTAFARERGLRIGSPIRLTVNSRVWPGRIAALIDENDAPADSRLAAIDLGWAQELFGQQGWLSSIQVRASQPEAAAALAEQIRPLVPADVSVAAPRQRSYQMQTMLGAFQLNLTALSLVSLLVGAFLVYNTVFASVTRRQTELGILRALGMSRVEIRCLFLGEACVFGALGIALGSVGGLLLAQFLIGAVEKTVSSLYLLLRIEQIHLSPWQFVVAGAFGIAAVIVGAWLPADEASRIDPVGTLSLGVHGDRSADRLPRWHWLGLASLVIAGGTCLVALRTGPAAWAFVGAFFVLVGFALWAPLLTLGFGRLTSFGLRSQVVARLAADHLVRSIHRNAITVAALATAIAMTVGLMVMIHSFRESIAAWIERGIVADLFIAPAANEVVGLGSSVPEEVSAWLRARPEVESVDSFRELDATVRTNASDQSALLAVVDGAYRANLEFAGGDAEGRMARVFLGEAVVVTESFARKFRVGAGESLTLLTPRGPELFPIAGVYADYTRDQGVILMAYPRYAAGWGIAGPQSLAVYLKPESDPDALAADFRAQFGAQGEYLVYSNRSLRHRIFTIFDQTFAVTYVLRTIALIVAVLGIFLSVTTLVAERRRETGMLRALGASTGQIARLFMAEAGIIGVIASILGIAAGIALAMVLTWVVNPAFFGWTIHLHFPTLALVTMPCGIVVATVIAAWLPAAGAGKTPIAESIREE